MIDEQVSMHCQEQRPKMRRDSVNLTPTRLQEKRHSGAGKLPKPDFILKTQKAIVILDGISVALESKWGGWTVFLHTFFNQKYAPRTVLSPPEPASSAGFVLIGFPSVPAQWHRISSPPIGSQAHPLKMWL
jgi:hypothetical protein